MDNFSKLNPQNIALLLDVDGTLIDIKPAPDEVHVSVELRDLVALLGHQTGGALALVSGRPIAELDRLFAPLQLPAVGGHGAEIRTRPGKAHLTVDALPDGLRRRLAQGAVPGTYIEDKGYSLAVHYRNAPDDEDRVRASIEAARAAFPGAATEVQHGKFVFEVKRLGVNKGSAVRMLMNEAPFAGRKPVFIGDDKTDEAVFAILPELGGLGFSVARDFDGLAGIFETPSQVRRALKHLATRGERAPA